MARIKQSPSSGLRLLLLLAAVTVPQAARAETQIIWSVKDRFRLFAEGDADSRLRVEKTMNEIATGAPRIENHYDRLLNLLSEHAGSLRKSNFAPNNGIEIVRSGRYRPHYLYPEWYEVRVRAADVPPEHSCSWRVRQIIVRERCGADAVLRIPANAAGTGADAELFRGVNGGNEVRIEERISIADELIVAMGDSYISGEGNPDEPAVFHIDHKNDSRFARKDWPAELSLAKKEVTPAKWWDQPCHRSLLSWPVLASFVRASRSPQRAVTLVHLGCSGDEVADGLLAPRWNLPGGGRESQSQFDMLSDLRGRTTGPIRPIDRLFLMIGGNDIGFGGVVATLLLPPNGWRLGPIVPPIAGSSAGTVCPYQVEHRPLSRFCGQRKDSKDGGPPVDRRSAQERLGELGARIDQVANAFAEAGIGPKAVYQMTYPNALVSAAGQMCAHPNEGFEGLIGVFPRKRRGNPNRWRFEIQYYRDPNFVPAQTIDPKSPQIECDLVAHGSDSETCQAYWVWAELNSQVKTAVRKHSWGLIDRHQSAIKSRGWCNETLNYSLRLPLQVDGIWPQGWSPADWRPYARDLPRWFRTTNDSVLTQWEAPDKFHKGSMHPTYHAHVVMAQAALDEAFPAED